MGDDGGNGDAGGDAVSSILASLGKKYAGKGTKAAAESRGEEAIATMLKNLAFQRRQLAEQEEAVKVREQTIGQREEAMSSREEDIKGKEADLERRMSDFEGQVAEKAQVLVREQLEFVLPPLAQVYDSDVSPEAKRTASASLLKNHGMREEDAMQFMLGLNRDPEIESGIKYLDHILDVKSAAYVEITSSLRAIQEVRRELDERAAALDARAEELVGLETDIAEREGSYLANLDAVERARVAMVENFGKVRALYNLLVEHTKMIQETMFPDLNNYAKRMNNIKEFHKIKIVALMLSNSYTDMLDPRPESGDIITSTTDVETTHLRSLLNRTRSADTEVFGTDENLGEYLVSPIRTQQNNIVARFCAAGISTKQGRLSEKDRERMRNVSHSVRTTVLSHYAALSLISEYGRLGYERQRMVRLEQELRDMIRPEKR